MRRVAATAVYLCGDGGIRTRGTVAGTHDFQSCTFDHSVTSPSDWSGSALQRTEPGGERGIRTHGTRKGSLDFESSAFDHSASSPRRKLAEGALVSTARGPDLREESAQ